VSTPTILLVGHGYLGEALASLLVSRGSGVVAVARNPVAGQAVGYPVLAADLGEADSVAALAAASGETPSAIVHCASSGRGGPEAYRRVFVDGMRHLRRHFPGVPVFFTSSTSVYGQTDGSLVDEGSPAEPDRETSRFLLKAESLARESGGAALRLAGIYGPGRSIYLRRLFDGSATIESGATSRFLNQIHRDDAAAAAAHLLALPREATAGRVFNVVDDEFPTQRELYERLCARFGLPLPPEALPDLDRKRAWTNKRVSNAALRATGWSPRFPSFFDAVEHDPELVPSLRGRAGN